MVNYNNFAKTFSNSRKNMKWEEIIYFINYLDKSIKTNDKRINVLDIWCGNWRLLSELKNSWLQISNYLWVDLSKELLVEAKKIHPNFEFLELDMLNIDSIQKKIDCIFFIASFHHLQTVEERLDVLKQAKNLLNEWWIIFMTNWALHTWVIKDRYKKSKKENSENQFWSFDFDIKIGDFSRYYHSFYLEELEYLFKETWFKVSENRLFDTEKNIISIIKK